MVPKTLHTLGPQHVTALRAFLWRLTGRGRTAAELDSEIAAGSIAFPVL